MDNHFTDCNKALSYLINKYQLGAKGVLDGGLLRTGGKEVKLLPWRCERRFIELKNIIVRQTIEDVSTIHCCYISSGKSLDQLILRELDICEWLGGGSVKMIFAVFNGNNAANIIIKLANDISCSIECSVMLPADTADIDNHEIIARRGVASDQAVDTQVAQHSIYSYTADPKTFDDTDAEIFGLSPEDTNIVRSAFDALSDNSLAARHEYLQTLVAGARESDAKRAPFYIRGQK